MKIRNREELILSLICRVLEKDNCIFGELEPMGDFTVSGGTVDKLKKDGTLPKRKNKNNGQYIKAKFAIPHEAIADKYTENIVVFNDAFHMPTAGIHEMFASDKLKAMAEKKNAWWAEYTARKPRLASAIKELLEAVAEEVSYEKERAKANADASGDI